MGSKFMLVAVHLSIALWVGGREAWAWSLAGHRLVSNAAVEAASDKCRPLLEGRRRQMAFHAIEPDIILKPLRGRKEEVKHFIDLDSYGPSPFTALPRNYQQAIRKLGRQTVVERGVLPWTIVRMARQLEKEIKGRNWHYARVTAGRLGHYVADAYMPLHLTANHDGQLTGQRGIHHPIERLVDMEAAQYERLVKARARVRQVALSRLRETIFADMVESYRGVEEILAAERKVRVEFTPGSSFYREEMQKVLQPLLVRQLAKAASTLAGIWVAACADHLSPRHPAPVQQGPSNHCAGMEDGL